MDGDDKEPEDAAAEPTPDAAQEEGAKLREVSEDELKRILAAHKKWVETDGKEGERADLSRTNLQDAALARADLRGAVLTSAQNLTREQLDEACGDDKTKPPNYLPDYKMRACPEPEQSPAN